MEHTHRRTQRLQQQHRNNKRSEERHEAKRKGRAYANRKHPNSRRIAKKEAKRGSKLNMLC